MDGGVRVGECGVATRKENPYSADDLAQRRGRRVGPATRAERSDTGTRAYESDTRACSGGGEGRGNAGDAAAKHDDLRILHRDEG
jgi:hypothetical protein